MGAHYYNSSLGGIAGDGNPLTGYAGEIDKKVKLLSLENTAYSLTKLNNIMG